MESNELRIGNLVHYHDEHLKPNDEVIKISYLDLMIIHHKEKYHHYSPIPLTEEWLLKFGFTKTDNKYFIGELNELNNRQLDLILCTDKNVISYQDYLHPILYVHQLQNLYFALTGEELTIDNE